MLFSRIFHDSQGVLLKMCLLHKTLRLKPNLPEETPSRRLRFYFSQKNPLPPDRCREGWLSGYKAPRYQEIRYSFFCRKAFFRPLPGRWFFHATFTKVPCIAYSAPITATCCPSPLALLGRPPRSGGVSRLEKGPAFTPPFPSP